ncbi:dipeptidyl peptidase 3-like [Ptychodera flava]|uniref:dipeptidyl peptidase 3-like n=1 Tax=Ptychodera flava TaxID=63121 RepID=UPI00396A968C
MADSQFVIPNGVPVANLDCKVAFEGLTEKEKLYAHFLAQGSWEGGLIVLFQTSAESPTIFMLLQKLFKAQKVSELEEASLKADNGPTKEDFEALLTYAAAFYSNSGNYKSFGDTKFVPNLPKEKFYCVIKSSAAYAKDAAGIEELWDACNHALYSLGDRERELGLGDKGITTYFSSNCTMQDAEKAQKLMNDKDISPYNTRLFKTVDANGAVIYEIRLASSLTTDESVEEVEKSNKCGTYNFEGDTFKVTRGDYAPLMARMNDNLKLAKEHAANDNERDMLEHYVNSFTTGSVKAHMDGSRSWIKDKGPVVESYIGFIESYRDPFGARGEFEGFVSMVNKQMSAKFSDLVSRAEEFLPILPWPKEYEKDKFLRPDFTSLDVMCFASSGIPAGINIPNYDNIRQEEGFKNVSLGNVLSAHTKEQKVTFLTDEDRDLFSELKAPSFELQVGLHELLGHGSGKLFQKEKDGKLNFDTESVKHLETGAKIESWYLPGETWDTKFPVIASTYEECRAECVGLYLCLNREILKIFSHEGKAAENIFYVNWLNMVRAGLLALEFYTPETKAWRQAHMQARYVILRVLLEAGEGLVEIEPITGEDGKPDAVIRLDRSKIETVGKTAIGNFLRKLQLYKSTADFENGKAMYENYSTVNDDNPQKFMTLRNVILARKQPRRMFVQANTTMEEGKVVLQEYDATVAGIVQSFVERYPDDTTEQIIKDLWTKDKEHFNF